MGVVYPQIPLLAAITSRAFESSVLALGGLLIVGALVSGLVRRSILTLTAVFVLAGFLLGDGVTGALHFDARSGFVGELATVALIVILFRDGLEVEAEMLQVHWRLPSRKLVLAMPLTAGVIALATRVMTGLSWTQSLLLGALLSPTDPVLSSAVVTNPRVPRLVRHSLNLESGLNDGLALPAVLVLAAALGAGHFVWWQFVLENLGLGLVAGLLTGGLAAWIMPTETRFGLGAGIPSHQKALYALGVACTAYGVAVLLPHGNGLIAVYVAAITLGIRRPDLRVHFARQAADLVEIVKLGIFVVFGALLTPSGLFESGWGAAGVAAVTLLVARPVGVFTALARSRTDLPTRAFMSWFGPKGVATMTFSLLVLGDQIPRGRTIFHLAALVVFCSILAHGVTDTAGAEWIGRRAERAEAEVAAGHPSPVG
ncbi:MAG TPA: cation:proton antiporter [Solirubrobacteraceae bacterium]